MSLEMAVETFNAGDVQLDEDQNFLADVIRHTTMTAGLTPSEAFLLSDLWQLGSATVPVLQERLHLMTNVQHAKAVERGLYGLRDKLPVSAVTHTRDWRSYSYSIDPAVKAGLVEQMNQHLEWIAPAKEALNDWAADYFRKLVESDEKCGRKALHQSLLGVLILNTGWWQSAETILGLLPDVKVSKNENFSRTIGALGASLPAGVLVHTGLGNKTRYRLDPDAIIALQPPEPTEPFIPARDQQTAAQYEKTFGIRSSLGVTILSVLAGRNNEWVTRLELNKALEALLGHIPTKEKIHRAVTAIASHGIIEIEKVPVRGAAISARLMRINSSVSPVVLGPFLSAEKAAPVAPRPPKPRAKPKPKVPKADKPVPEQLPQGHDKYKNIPPAPIPLVEVIQDEMSEHMKIALDMRSWLEADPDASIHDMAETYLDRGFDQEAILEIIESNPLFFRFIDGKLSLTPFAQKRPVVFQT